MSSKDLSTVTASTPEHPEPPTEQAMLNIRSSPVTITVSAQGAATKTLTLGVIGPVGMIVAGHFAYLPAWAITLLCALQIAAVMAYRWS